MHTVRRFTAVVVVVTIAGVINAGVAMAAPPTNDTEASAVVVDAVPFTHSMDTTEATPGGPRFCWNSASVFYRFTPTEDVRVQADLIGTEYDPTLGVYTRDVDGQVQAIGCNDDRFGLASGLRFRASAGTTYYFIVGQCCSNGRTGGGDLVFTLSHVVAERLTLSFELAGTGTVDAETGIATISGTVTCNKRAAIDVGGTLRQLREEIFLARGDWSTYGEACTPGTPLELSFEVDTSTGVVFGSGEATARRFYLSGYDGWREGYYENDVVTSRISLL
jgi:hypothetical protein